MRKYKKLLKEIKSLPNYDYVYEAIKNHILTANWQNKEDLDFWIDLDKESPGKFMDKLINNPYLSEVVKTIDFNSFNEYIFENGEDEYMLDMHIPDPKYKIRCRVFGYIEHNEAIYIIYKNDNRSWLSVSDVDYIYYLAKMYK